MVFFYFSDNAVILFYIVFIVFECISESVHYLNICYLSILKRTQFNYWCVIVITDFLIS